MANHSHSDDPTVRLRALIESAVPALLRLSDDKAARPSATNEWSPKETLGYLIDTAESSQQRLDHARLQDHFESAGYTQDDGVEAQRYGEADWSALVTLWWMYNTHLVRTMKAASEDLRLRPPRQCSLRPIAQSSRSEHKYDTLDDFVRDYEDHLRRRLARILPAQVLDVPSPRRDDR